MKVVAITGPMRSGTSLVGAVVHRLGFAVASVIPAPTPPAWRSDWEDPELTPMLMERELVCWDEYIAARKEHAQALGFTGVAIKSPYLLLYLQEIVDRVDFLILTRRAAEPMRASMKRSPQLSERDQAEMLSVIREGAVHPDMEISCEAARYSPNATTQALAQLLGVEDERAIEAAACLIQPMEEVWLR